MENSISALWKPTKFMHIRSPNHLCKIYVRFDDPFSWPARPQIPRFMKVILQYLKLQTRPSRKYGHCDESSRRSSRPSGLLHFRCLLFHLIFFSLEITYLRSDYIRFVVLLSIFMVESTFVVLLFRKPFFRFEDASFHFTHCNSALYRQPYICRSPKCLRASYFT